MFSFLKNLVAKNKQGYYFIHIPKTAGTSFINLLDRCVDEDEIFPAQLWQQVNQKFLDKKKQFKLIRGHFGGGAYKLLSPNNPHLLTILRHPQSLSISTFHFIKREKNTAVHELVTSKDMSLLEFLQEPLTAKKINNRMVRHMSFDLQSDPEAQELFLSKQSIEVVSNWIKTPKKINNQQRLVRAKKLLDQCSWFGLQEQFDQSMQLFTYKFKLPPIGKSARLNTHNPKQDIDNQCKSLIAEQNNYDIVLYSYAQKQFKEKYHQMCQHLSQLFSCECNEENLDQLLDKYYQQHNILEVKSKVNYDFANKLIGSGWHRRELTMPENSYFRWTNTGSAFINFNLEVQNYNLTIRIINAICTTHLDKLEVIINNQKIAYNYNTNKGVVRILSAKINQSIIDNKPLKIQLNHPKTAKHSEIFNSDDERSLGIAVNWIKILPCNKKQ